MKRLILTALALAAFAPGLAPKIAHAASGYITCQAYQADKNRVLYTLPFPGDEADTGVLYDRFVAHLADSGYTKSMYATEPTPVEGICNWESSEAAAREKTEGYKAAYESRGASTMGVSGFPE